MSVTVQKEWWTAEEIADAALDDMPNTRQGVEAQAKREKWRTTDLARRREGRGGGWEYHWTLFSDFAHRQLLRAALKTPDPIVIGADRDARWEAFEKLPDRHKAKAQMRLNAIDMVHQFEMTGVTRDMAVTDAAKIVGCSGRSIWNWMDMVFCIPRADWLAYLAPRYQLGPNPSKQTQIDPDFIDIIKSDWLRLGGPSLKSAYDRAVDLASTHGIETVSYDAVRKHLKRTVSKPTEVFMRRGEEALKRLYPPQTRDKSAMRAMEGVNGDFHRFDVFVRFPGAQGQPDEIIRPQMVAFQDLFSGRLLSWRVDRSANSHAVQLCLGDMIEDWGIPEHVLLDNGREFAAKAITGGTPTRFRFKVRDDDIPGLLTTLGCKVHWATPYSGQSKPIERAFRDLCDRVSKHPAFQGAYTGNRPDAKPEDYGTRAIPLNEFLTILSAEIEKHNLRPDRRTETAFGRSFAEVFDESYSQAPIRKATAAQRRLWLLGAEGVRAHTRTGQITFMGNKYYAPWMLELAGKRVVARFDRADLWAGLHLYSLTGEYLGHAECQEKVGFFDIDEGRAHAKARGDWMKAERAAARAHRKFTAAELADLYASAEPELGAAASPPEARVVRMTPNPRPREERAPDPAVEAKQAEIVSDFEARKFADVPRQDEEDERDLVQRAFDLEARIKQGEDLTRDQRKWLSSFQSTPTYRGWKKMVESFGMDALAK